MLKPNGFFFFLLCFSPLFQFKSIIYSLYPTCIVLVLCLYSTCIVLVLYLYCLCLSLVYLCLGSFPGSSFQPCIVLVLFLYPTCIVLVLLPHTPHLPITIYHLPFNLTLYCACILLVLYLYCRFYLSFRLLPSIKPLSTSPCIVLVLWYPVYLSSIIYHLSPTSPCIVLVSYLHSTCIIFPGLHSLPYTCILLVLCLYCHSTAPFAFSCNALYTSIPLSVNRYF